MGSPSETAGAADGWVAPAVAAIDELVSRRPPTLDEGRLVCVDGPAGSGKTTLAAALAAGLGATVVHMDDLYDGWSGLGSVSPQLNTLLRPLARGRAGFYRRYDWHRDAYAEVVDVEPTGLLVVEGVGSGAAELAALITALVWVTAPRHLRRQRALARDGATFARQWSAWRRQEEEHFAVQRTAERADLLVDTA